MAAQHDVDAIGVQRLTMSDQAERQRVLEFLLTPLVRFCFRHSHSFQDLMRAAKVIFVNVAVEEMARRGEKVNVSRLAVITGLYRQDVTAVYRKKSVPNENTMGILWRVVGQWENDSRFITSAGQPRVLSYEGDGNEFATLCENVSKHVYPGTLLFELERIKAVERTPRGLKLLRPMYRVNTDVVKGFEMLGHDVDELISAVEENLVARRAVSNLHISTEYDNVAVDDMPKIRKWFIEEGKRFHKLARDFLSTYDRDVNPEIGEDDRAVGKVQICSFSFTSEFPEVPKPKK